MLVLGIDPGYAIVGYGAVDYLKGRYMSIGYGAVTTDADVDFNRRLEIIYDNCLVMFNKCRPDAIAIEKLYFNNNQKTAIGVAQARGVILLAAKKAGIQIYEYTPLQVKIAVTGYGQATKLQVMEMTKKLLHLKKMPKLDDTMDALAIAICHANTSTTNLKLKLVHEKKGV